MKRIACLAAAIAGVAAAAAFGDAPRPIAQLTRQTDDPFSMPSYLSKRVETQAFEGCFVAIDPQEEVAIEVISDDGCDVTIDDALVLNCFNKPQHLPDPAQSVKRIPESGGVVYGAGVHRIRVEYSNIIFNGQHLDIDGCTLVAPGLRFFQCKDVVTAAPPGGNNGVGNGVDPAPPGSPPPNDGAGTSPGNPGNAGGSDPGAGAGSPADGNAGAGGNANGNAGPKGDNGVAPQPPGNPPTNDAPGTGPGNPGNKGGATK